MLHLQIIFITQEGRDDSSVWEMGFFWILCIHNILLTILLLNSIPATTKGVTPAVKFHKQQTWKFPPIISRFMRKKQTKRKKRDLYLGVWSRLYIPYLKRQLQFAKWSLLGEQSLKKPLQLHMSLTLFSCI